MVSQIIDRVHTHTPLYYWHVRLDSHLLGDCRSVCVCEGN